MALLMGEFVHQAQYSGGPKRRAGEVGLSLGLKDLVNRFSGRVRNLVQTALKYIFPIRLIRNRLNLLFSVKIVRGFPKLSPKIRCRTILPRLAAHAIACPLDG